jgi:hypothetical protein
MHTSKRLKSSDFQYRIHDKGKSVRADFSSFCTDYHELDRIGVVSPRIGDGVLHTSYALLSLTTAFYDILRSRTSDFFDYPQHFAFINTSGEIDKALVGATWGNLDVWPDSNWIAASGTMPQTVKTVFDYQINRLFWPQNFKPASDKQRLPAYMFKILSNRLKAVYYYNTAHPNIEIHATQQVETVVAQSIAQLPEGDAQIQPYDLKHSGEEGFPYVQLYRKVEGSDFLEEMERFFDQS